MLKFLKWLFLSIFVFIAGSIALLILCGIGAIVVAIVDGEKLAQLQIESDRAIGVVSLEGEIISSKKFRKSLKKMVDHEKIKAVVVRIDSPGGAVGASEEIYRAIKQADTKKPVVCSLGNLAASGGLYSAVACRKILTNKGTLSGSIGVIMMSPNFSQLFDKFGLEMTVVKSGKFKDAGSPFRPQTEEDRQLLESLVDLSYDQFLSAVATGRSLDKEEVRKYADGRIILGEQAVEWGLADSFGGVEDAAALALELSGDTSGEEPEIVHAPGKDGFQALLSDFSERSRMFIYSWSKPRLLYRIP